MSEETMRSESANRRLQSAADIGISVLIAILLWPFPVARRLLEPAAHVLGVLITCGIVQLVYFEMCAIVWHRTLGMRLAGLTIVDADGGAPQRGRPAVWGLLAASLALWYLVMPAAACRAAIPERASGLRVMPTEE